MTSPVSSVSSVSSVADVTDLARGTISRRAVVIGSAWAVPVIASSSTLQLAAASAGPAVSVSVPNGRVPAAGQSPVTAVVVDSSGSPVAGAAVSFTGSSGVSFSPSNATTDGAGQATTTATTSNAWAVPGSTITVSALSGGASATAATTVLGANAYATGDNQYGSAGTGSGDSMLVSASQVALAFPSPVRSIVSANGFSLALLEDGSVWSVGRNSRGQLGDGTTTNRSTWAVIPGISNAVAVAAAATSFGAGTGYALLADKTVLAWGANGSGQLGNGTTAGSSTPVAVSTISSAVGIAAGQSTAYALLSDGSVMAWGDNSQGQLGSGSAGGNSSAPVAVGAISGAVEVVAGSYTAYARLSDGTVMAWGRGDYGQLGNGSTSSTASVVQVSSIGSSMATAVGLAAGDSTGYALLNDGTIAAWGVNSNGQLGNGTSGLSANSSIPVTVSGITTATAVRGGGFSAYAALDDGRIAGWGAGSSGQLGTGTNNDESTPVVIPHLRSGTRLTPSSPLSNTLHLVTTPATVSVSVPNGRVPASGQSTVTAVVVDSSGSPVAGVMVSFTGSSGVSFSPSNATTDGAGQATTTATTSNAWAVPGSTISISALNGGASGTTTPTILGANAYAAGSNSYGSAGTGSGDSMLVSATQVSLVFPSPVRSIASAYGFSLAVLEDGSVWSVGRNNRGQLGDGTTSDRSTWAMIPGISNAMAVAAAVSSFGAGSGYALLADKTVLAWGANGSGQLGNGTTAGSSTPVAVSTISSAVGIAAGQSTAYALLSDGSVMAWGDNSFGQLGSGTAGGTSSSPVAVGGISDAVEMVAGNAMAFVRRPDGTVMAWGRGDYGQLGNGSTSSTASVVQVSSIGSSMATAVGLAAGDSTGYAVLTDGTIASWGLNNKGQLGNGTDGVFSNVSSPVTVSGITNATAVRGGDYSAYAVGVDGRVRAWGSGSSGQLATGTNNDQNTPVIAPDLRSGTRLTPSSPLSSTLHLLT